MNLVVKTSHGAIRPQNDLGNKVTAALTTGHTIDNIYAMPARQRPKNLAGGTLDVLRQIRKLPKGLAGVFNSGELWKNYQMDLLVTQGAIDGLGYTTNMCLLVGAPACGRNQNLTGQYPQSHLLPIPCLGGAS